MSVAPTPNNPDGKSLLVRIIDKLKSKMSAESKVIVEHVEQEIIDLRDDFKKEIARLEGKIANAVETALTPGTVSGTNENPTLTATGSTPSLSSEVAAQNEIAAKSTV